MLSDLLKFTNEVTYIEVLASLSLSLQYSLIIKKYTETENYCKANIHFGA